MKAYVFKVNDKPISLDELNEYDDIDIQCLISTKILYCDGLVYDDLEAVITIEEIELEKLKEQNKKYKAFFDELKLDTEVGDYDDNDYCSSYEILISNNVDVELNSSDEKIIKLYKEIIKDE